MDDGNQANPNDPSSSSSTVNDPTLTQTQQTQTEKLLEPSPRNFPSTLRVWWPEMLTCVLILGMFGAVVGTIHPYQGKPLPNWPYHLQINTVVSIYFTVIKACMLFILAEGLGQLKWGWFSSGQTRPLYHLAAYDNATRGPWGSLNLLWKLRCRTFLPSVAALAIVLATIVDPFGQQIIRFYPCAVPATQANGESLSASVTRNRFVDGGFPGGGLSATDTDVLGGWTISGEMQDAIMSGIYNSPKTIKPFCPTGNCTFSVPYVSAGWCSKCTDLTSQVKVVDVPESNYTALYAMEYLNFTLPAHKNATLPSTEIILLLGSDGPKDAMRGTTPTYFSPDAWVRNKFSAATCSLSPCVRKYNSTVTNGLMRENVLAQSSDWGSGPKETYQSTCWSILDISCLNSTEKSSLRRINYTFSDSDAFLKYHYSGWTYPDIPKADDSFLFEFHEDRDKYYLPESGLRDQCIYQVCWPTINSIQAGLSNIFDAQWAGFNPWVSGSTQGNFMDGPAHLQSIYQNGNLSMKSLEKIFESVANRMTLVNRRAGRQYIEQEKGEVWGQDTCVDVRWLWILYPGVLGLVTLGFLVGAILTGRGMFGRLQEGGGQSVRRQGYKNGILPLVLFGVETKDTAQQHGGSMGAVGGTAAGSAVDIGAVESGTAVNGVVERIGEIEELSKKIKVRLDRTERGWRFKEV
ncbi:Protein of unknown function (DUF3176) domain containing protein [Rhypophila decipiens]